MEVDIDKVSSCGSDIIKLSNDLKNIIDSLFSDINKISTEGIWLGNSASNFIQKVASEKQFLINYANELYNYGDVLKENASEFKRTINKINE